MLSRRPVQGFLQDLVFDPVDLCRQGLIPNSKGVIDDYALQAHDGTGSVVNSTGHRLQIGVPPLSCVVSDIVIIITIYMTINANCYLDTFL